MRGGSGGEGGGCLTRSAPLEGFGSGRALIPSEALHETDRYIVEVLAAGLLRPQALIDLFRPLRRSGRPHPIIQTESNWKNRDEKEQHKPPPVLSSRSHAPDVRAVAEGVNSIRTRPRQTVQVLAETAPAFERLRLQKRARQDGIGGVDGITAELEGAREATEAVDRWRLGGRNAASGGGKGEQNQRSEQRGRTVSTKRVILCRLGCHRRSNLFTKVSLQDIKAVACASWPALLSM